MTQVVEYPTREMNVAKTLAGLAVVSALLSAVAGLILIAATPASGSTLEGVLGISAAVFGLATAGLAIAAIIYAQVKNLWQYMPTWIRVAVWVLIAYAIISSLWGTLNSAG